MNRLVATLLDHGWWTMQNVDDELAFSDEQWTFLEISWLLLSDFRILHLQQQQNSFHSSPHT